MSMEILTLLQIIGIFCAYFAMTFVLPAILLYIKVKHLTFSVRFMIYQALGNFYMMNLVLALQLLHISNRFTLIVFTVIPFSAAFAFVHGRNVQQDMHDVSTVVRRLLEGQYGVRLYFRRKMVLAKGLCMQFAAAVRRRFLNNIPDIVLVLLVTAAVMGTYGVNAFRQFGYCTSDIVVHNYWINYMGKGEMFAAGVYPFGFHCVIYYLHIVFGIDTYVLLRLFWIVQTLLIHLLLLAFIRICSKSKYVAYAGLGIYTLVGIFGPNTYTRYISSLPQEFGMVFILPSAAFLLLFFEKKKQELLLEKQEEEQEKKQEKKQEKEEKAYGRLLRRTFKKTAVHAADKTAEKALEPPPEEERVYFLDDVLAQSAARKNQQEPLENQPQEAEMVLIIEENPLDGTFTITERPIGEIDDLLDTPSQPAHRVQDTAAKQNKQNGAEKDFALTKLARGIGRKGRAARESRRNEEHASLRQRLAVFVKQEFSRESAWYLVLFILNLSMTFTVHFYNTMIAGVFCVGIAAGYCFRLFRKQYFGRVVLSGILAIMISVLPMFLAFLGGTPLEGSLRWGMSIIKGTADQPAEEKKDDDIHPEDIAGFLVVSGKEVYLDGELISENGMIKGGTVLSIGDITVGQNRIKGGQMVSDAKVIVDGEVYYEGAVISIGNNLPEPQSGTKGDSDGDLSQAGAEITASVEKLIEQVKEKAAQICHMTVSVMDMYLIGVDSAWLNLAAPVSILLLFVLAVLYFFLRQTEYAARMMSTAAYMIGMTAVFIAPAVGLPELMDDESRTCIYYAYSIIIVWCLCMDSILQLLLGWMKKKYLLNLASLFLIPVIAVPVTACGMVKQTQYTESMQSNDAVICLTNIIRDNRDFTWTIVSANDEVRMGEDHGYHYELDTFLRKMEHQGGGSLITIPTKKVYFFIEKRPIDYAKDYAGSGQLISRIGAANPLPFRSGITMYQAQNRWIEMSRLYYWAQRFMRMYPNEIEVYYESNKFICYCVEQNEYSLYNFSINYAYNMIEYTEE